jgi:hypothetical protein
MEMLDGETLRKMLKTTTPHEEFAKAGVAKCLNVKMDVGAIVDAYCKYWDIVSECERVLRQMNKYIAVLPKFLPKTSVEILKSGIPRPADWWRVMARDCQIVNPENPTMEVAAWDGCEPDANCNCSVTFPVKWLYMSGEELGEMFKKEMEK